MKKMEWGKGLVQKDDVERQKREQAEMKFKPLARCRFPSLSTAFWSAC